VEEPDGVVAGLVGVVAELGGETLGLGAGPPLFVDPVAGVVDPDVPVLDVPVLDVPVPDVPVPEVPVPDVPVPEVPVPDVPVPEVPVPDVPEPELVDPEPDGEGLGEGFLLGLLVGVEVPDEVGCGADDDVDEGVGDGCDVAGGEDFATVPEAVEPEGGHDGVGADTSANRGASGPTALPRAPGAGGVEPVLAGCSADACEPLPPLTTASDRVAVGSTGWHGELPFVSVGVAEFVVLGVPEAAIAPGPEPPGGAAEPGPGIPP